MEKRSILVSCVELDLRFIFTKGSTLIDAVFKRFCGWALGSGHCLHTVYMSRLLSRSWQIDGETVETVADFIFFGSKITADGDCSHEIKRRLLLGRKVMTNLDSTQTFWGGQYRKPGGHEKPATGFHSREGCP